MARKLTEEQLFCLLGCRDFPQYHKMRSGFESGRCEFCNLDRNVNHVLYENEHWVLWKNPFPRKTLKKQYVIASREHIRYLEQITPEGWRSFYFVIQWLEAGVEGQYECLQGGNLHVRFGDMRYNAGTVPHLHWNYWVPNGTGEVRIPVMKDVKDSIANESRADGFSRRYEAGETP